MTALVVAMAAAYGVYLLYTAVAFGWTGLGPGPVRAGRRPARERAQDWMRQAGLDEVRPAELAAVVAVLGLLGGGMAWTVFGGALAPLAGGGFAATLPVATARGRRARRRREARDNWPRLIEEIRIQATSLGRSLPQALFEVGRRGPDELRPAFEAARREWLISTDFERTLDVLKGRLADATADAVCETLLVAHEIGGNDIDRCLTALVEDRILDLQGRKDARSRQAGAVFARRFVLMVPVGMALIGLSIGDGRAAYQTPTGQVLVAVGLALIGLCWVWAGRVMRLPEEQRVFAGVDAGGRSSP